MAVQHPERQARRFLKSLSLPAEVGRILPDNRAWSEEFCKLYFELCDDVLFRDPRKGFKLAKIAPQLAAKIPETGVAEAQSSRAGFRVQAWCLLGGAYRATGLYDSSERMYQNARRTVQEEDIPAFDEANFHRRLAGLRLCQGRLEEALDLCQRAIDIYRSANNVIDLGWSLTVRGTVHVAACRHALGIQDFGETLSLINPKAHARIYHSAVHNLSFAITASSMAKFDLGTARMHIRRAKECIRNHRRSIPRAKLVWIEGLMFMKAGLTRRGEALLRSARQLFIGLDASFELALVSLDLTELYLLEGRWHELRQLAAETFRTFTLLSADKKALRTLRYWYEAVRAQTVNARAIAVARDQIHRRWPF